MRRVFLFLIAFFGLAVAIAASATAPGARAAPQIAPPEARADRVIVEKSARRISLMKDGAVIAAYDIALGFAPVGDKAREGDGRTPEGVYHVDRRNARSGYHLSLGLTYPTAAERAEAAREGRDPGGDIFIHGQPNALPRGMTIPGDWTAGCVAVADAEIEAIWRLVAIGTPVEIRP